MRALHASRFSRRSPGTGDPPGRPDDPMPHPLASLPPGRGRRLFLPLLALTVLVMVVMNSAGAPPGNTAAPQGYPCTASNIRRAVSTDSRVPTSVS